MAIVRAFRSTDLTRDFADGFLAETGRSRIVVEDFGRTGEFRGLFAFSKPGAIVGTIDGYAQTVDGRAQFSIDDLAAPAGAIKLLLQGEGGLFRRILFAGDDSMNGSPFADLLAGYDGGDRLFGAGGDDALFGGDGRDRLYGGEGDDDLNGGRDTDWAFGSSGDDRLSGGSGRDFLEGGRDDDRLTGGLDRDLLTGDGGDDIFRYLDIRDSAVGKDRRDTITDFGDGDDRVDLSLVDADLTAAGRQSFDFIGNDPFSGEAGELRYSPGLRRLMGDTTGDGKADFEIVLHGVVDIGRDELIL
jgi:Ca2+-binding RTX toxin-like protein